MFTVVLGRVKQVNCTLTVEALDIKLLYMAHIQQCTVCKRKVACLACSRASKKGIAAVKRKKPAEVREEQLCLECGNTDCDCGGFEDEEEEDEEEDEEDGYGGGCETWDGLAAAFLTDDDEDPLGDNEDSDIIEEWKPQKPKRQRQQKTPQPLIFSTPAAVVTTKLKAKRSNPSGLGADYIPLMMPPLQQFQRLSPSKKPILNTSETMLGIASEAMQGMPFYTWAKSIGTITQRWDNPVTYIPGRKIHGGTDIAKLPIGAPITAFRAGTVIEVSGNSTLTTGWGLTIVLVDEKGQKHRYAHLLESFVRVGAKVQQGEVIAAMGKSGNVFGKTGIHLHYEVKDKFNNILDPDTI